MHPRIAQLFADYPPALTTALGVLSGELLRWRRVHNLTGHRDQLSVAVDLFLDSLALVPHVQGPSLLDIGSGAGFPGLVLALALPGLRVSLLESRAKRVSFQKHAVRVLGLGPRVRPVLGRAEPGVLGDELFDTVTLRAVGSLEESLSLARPFVAPGGRVLLPRGQGDRRAAEALGLRVVDYQLPPPGGARLLAIHRELT